MRRAASCVLFLVLLLVAVDDAKATTHEFTVQPKSDVVVLSRELSRSDRIFGDVTVQGGLADFSIVDPKGSTVFTDNQSSHSSFDIAASEDGNYTFRFANTLTNETLNAVLNYGIAFQRVIEESISFGTSIGMVHVVAPRVPPILDEHFDEIDHLRIDLYGKYLLRQSEKLLNVVKEFWKYLDLNTTEVCTITIFAMMFTLSICFMPSDPLKRIRQVTKGRDENNRSGRLESSDSNIDRFILHVRPSKRGHMVFAHTLDRS